MSQLKFSDPTLDLKQMTENGGVIEGWVTTYGPPPDRVGDIIMPGAFGEKEFSRPFLLNHNKDIVLGRADFQPREEGVFMIGTLATQPEAQKARDLAAMGALSAFSFGYQTLAGKPNSHGGEDIEKADVAEGSLVTIPANPRALVTAVKSLIADLEDEEAQDLEEEVKEVMELIHDKRPIDFKQKEIEEQIERLEVLTKGW